MSKTVLTIEIENGKTILRIESDDVSIQKVKKDPPVIYNPNPLSDKQIYTLKKIGMYDTSKPSDSMRDILNEYFEMKDFLEDYVSWDNTLAHASFNQVKETYDEFKNHEKIVTPIVPPAILDVNFVYEDDMPGAIILDDQPVKKKKRGRPRKAL